MPTEFRIPIRPEFLFTSQRNVHSHRPEYPVDEAILLDATSEALL